MKKQNNPLPTQQPQLSVPGRCIYILYYIILRTVFFFKKKLFVLLEHMIMWSALSQAAATGKLSIQ